MMLSTRDKVELDHFKSLSPTWWDEKGPFKILHAITPLRMAFIKEKVEAHFLRSDALSKPLTGLRVLDVGCGGGLLCEPLARLGACVIGLDPVEENITVAKAHAEAMGLEIAYFPCAVEDLPRESPPFDVIVASEIIEHVANPDAFLKACGAHLSPQGGMVVTTFNKTLKSYLLGILAAEYILKWAPQGTHSWGKFISPQDLSQKLSSLGLESQDLTGLRFSPLTGRWGFSSSLDVNYFLWGARSKAV